MQHLAHGGAGIHLGLLAEVGQVGGSGDRTGLGAVEAGKDAEQRRLADAVLAHQPDRLSGLGDEADAVEHDAIAEGARHVGGDEGLE